MNETTKGTPENGPDSIYRARGNDAPLAEEASRGGQGRDPFTPLTGGEVFEDEPEATEEAIEDEMIAYTAAVIAAHRIGWLTIGFTAGLVAGAIAAWRIFV